ncbi:MAG: helix-turn-helix domain-containing protein [Solirubrobacterales bacterium]
MGEIGETLRERRMALKIDVHEVEEGTKIRAKYLRALENEEYDLLPGSAYVKSFLRTYAEYLGVDARRLVDIYKQDIEPRDDDQPIFGRADAVKDNSGPRQRRWILLAAAVAALLLILFLIGTIGGGSAGGP